MSISRNLYKFKFVDFKSKVVKTLTHVNARRQGCWFLLESSKMSISRNVKAQKCRFQVKKGLNVDFMLTRDGKVVDFT